MKSETREKGRGGGGGHLRAETIQLPVAEAQSACRAAMRRSSAKAPCSTESGPTRARTHTHAPLHPLGASTPGATWGRTQHRFSRDLVSVAARGAKRVAGSFKGEIVGRFSRTQAEQQLGTTERLRYPLGDRCEAGQVDLPPSIMRQVLVRCGASPVTRSATVQCVSGTSRQRVVCWSGG